MTQIPVPKIRKSNTTTTEILFRLSTIVDIITITAAFCTMPRWIGVLQWIIEDIAIAVAILWVGETRRYRIRRNEPTEVGS